jgi:hypothetical protein
MPSLGGAPSLQSTDMMQQMMMNQQIIAKMLSQPLSDGNGTSQQLPHMSSGGVPKQSQQKRT